MVHMRILSPYPISSLERDKLFYLTLHFKGCLTSDDYCSDFNVLEEISRNRTTLVLYNTLYCWTGP